MLYVHKYREFILIKEEKSEKIDYITDNDIVTCISNNGYILVSNIKNLPEHDENQEVTPVNIEGDTIEVSIDNNIYYTSLENVKKVSFVPIEKNDLEL